jgi:hypothetical protein
MSSPAVHAIETFVLTAVTAGMILYFVIFLLVTWSDRPQIGRNDDGSPRPARPVQRKGTQ